jgi:cytoskeletal protein CcmA (bactofilin family)
VFKRRKNEDPANPEAGVTPAGPVPNPNLASDESSLEVSLAAKTDNGLGVPPFRPALPKEAPAMGRTPYPAPTTPVAVPPGLNPSVAQSAIQSGPPGIRPAPGRNPNREPAERRTLIVGRGISVQGTVQDAERLVVEGTVEASMIHAAELSISPGGVFKGEVEVEDAEVAGTIDGTLMARGNLIVRSTGKVLGTARCRRLQVEDGGQITGRIEMLTETSAAAPRTAAELES